MAVRAGPLETVEKAAAQSFLPSIGTQPAQGLAVTSVADIRQEIVADVDARDGTLQSGLDEQRRGNSAADDDHDECGQNQHRPPPAASGLIAAHRPDDALREAFQTID